ncbi:hypothetical protein EDD11_005154 [Mortierella claussenii]|nr:hypothetical protein EDD11_005154 [Mortierella claussenii]
MVVPPSTPRPKKKIPSITSFSSTPPSSFKKQQRRRKSRVVDEDQEQPFDVFNPQVESDDDNDAYQPEEEATDEPLEYLEEDIVSNRSLVKETAIEILERAVGDHTPRIVIEEAIQEVLLVGQDEIEMVKADEREVAVGGGRRRGTVSGGESASTAAQGAASTNERSASPASGAGSGSGTRHATKGQNHESPGDTTHDKRRRAGYSGASAKVGNVDSHTAMMRAKYRVEGAPEGTALFHNGVPPPTPLPDIATPKCLSRGEDGSPKFELGTDLWNKVYAYHFPSELSSPALVNKEWRARAYYLPVWKKICEEAGLVVPESQLEKYGYERPNYYRIAHENSELICEVCFAETRPSGAYRALPVKLEEAPILTEIRMCRDCRVDYYIDHPKPFPADVVPYKQGEYTVIPRVTKGEAKKTYLLTDRDVMSLPYEIGRNPYFGRNSPMYLFEEQHVLILARQVHGGDIGIAATKRDTEYSGRKVPEPRDDVKKNRKNYLRSLLHENGLGLPEECAIAHIYIETGLGDPLEIVKELEAIDWFHRYTSYDPRIEKVHLRQIKRRPRIDRHRRTLPAEETLTGQNDGDGPMVVDNLELKDEIMTEEEEEEEDQHKMAALDDWLQHRLEQGILRHWKFDPEGSPDKPPEGVWPLLEKIDWGYKLMEFAVEKLYKAMERQKHIIRQQGLDTLALTKQQVKVIVDSQADQASGRMSELLRRKRMKTGHEGHQHEHKHHEKHKKKDEGADGEDDHRLRLSTLLGHEYGPDWHEKAVAEAKELTNTRLFTH